MSFVFTGGRNYKDKEKVERIIDLLLEIRVKNFKKIHVGDCPTGLDLFVRELCAHLSPDFFQVHRAQWDKLGRAAGPIRNQEMLFEAGSAAIVVAFPGGKGTLDCTERARARGMMIWRVE